MIIWGWRVREIPQGSGQFHCPKCETEQQYKQVRVATYFTLYFIPLIETEHHGDCVKCGGCESLFDPGVLNYRPLTEIERVILSIRADLCRGTPLQMARTKLQNAGAETEAADHLVGLAAGESLHDCDQCLLTYVDDVERCSACGELLQTHAGRLNIETE